MYFPRVYGFNLSYSMQVYEFGVPRYDESCTIAFTRTSSVCVCFHDCHSSGFRTCANYFSWWRTPWYHESSWHRFMFRDHNTQIYRTPRECVRRVASARGRDSDSRSLRRGMRLPLCAWFDGSWHNKLRTDVCVEGCVYHYVLGLMTRGITSCALIVIISIYKILLHDGELRGITSHYAPHV